MDVIYWQDTRLPFTGKKQVSTTAGQHAPPMPSKVGGVPSPLDHQAFSLVIALKGLSHGDLWFNCSMTTSVRRFPLHGWAGLALVTIFWSLNWGLSGLRTQWVFFPLWLGYCLVIDALVFWRDATILGMGRAIGETMAVLMVVGNAPILPKGIFSPLSTMTTQIVMDMPYAVGLHRTALFALAALLFVFSMALVATVRLMSRLRD